MPRCLDNYPWRSLKGCGDMAPNMFKVGDYKNVTLRNGSPAVFQIIGFNHDVTPDGRVLPMTFELVDCLPSRYCMNQRDTTLGNWGASDLCKQMNTPDGSIYRLIPEEIIELAEPVVKLTAETYDGENTITQSVHEFFVLSEKEVFGRNIYSAPGEGKWYEWYRQEDVPWYKLRNGGRDHRYLRSPYSSFSTNFCFVYYNGYANYYNASYSYGVSFGFSF